MSRQLSIKRMEVVMKAIWIKDETASRLNRFAASEDTWDEIIVKLLNIAESPAMRTLAQTARKMSEEEKAREIEDAQELASNRKSL
jgi:predicted CopG family antitoxin